jgi:hypothetical protein
MFSKFEIISYIKLNFTCGQILHNKLNGILRKHFGKQMIVAYCCRGKTLSSLFNRENEIPARLEKSSAEDRKKTAKNCFPYPPLDIETVEDKTSGQRMKINSSRFTVTGHRL